MRMETARVLVPHITMILGVALPWKYKHVYAEHMAWMLALDRGLGHKFMFKLWTDKVEFFLQTRSVRGGGLQYALIGLVHMNKPSLCVHNLNMNDG